MAQYILPALYLLLGWCFGYQFLRIFLPQFFYIEKQKSFVSRLNWMITIPASFLVGMLLLTWLTYLTAYLFRQTVQPLFYGNLISILLALFLILFKLFSNKKTQLNTIIKNIKQLKNQNLGKFFCIYRVEIIFLLVITFISSFIMFHTFIIKNGSIYIGYSVFSDFGPHLAMIRSFSYGSNFPTEYPHFADGRIRYHFLFQFLVGNLEFLGLRLDWAFNLPSILALVSFLMLLYTLAFLVTGERWIGIITVILFFFRSSFAFFTYIAQLLHLSFRDIMIKILTNDLFIGNTPNENWGLWTQNVYVNQRHLAFLLGIFLLIIIFMFPLFEKMTQNLKRVLKLDKPIKNWLFEFIVKKDAWSIQSWRRCITLGIILGLMSFWNGIVVVATLIVLFFLAIFSKHRIEYLVIAFLSIIIAYSAVLFFVGSAKGVVNYFSVKFGFLAPEPNLRSIITYYIELLGILPFLLIFAIFFVPHRIKWLGITFFMPFLFANVVQFTPDINVNHKFIIISVFLLNIIVARFLYYLFKGNFWGKEKKTNLTPENFGNYNSELTDGLTKQNKILSSYAQTTLRIIMGFLATLLFIILTITGVVDFITLYNLNLPPDKTIVVNINDPLLLWAKNNTKPNEIFLTDVYCVHPILLAGRKIFYGWPYYAWSAGYETENRRQIVIQIYGGEDINQVRALLKANNIKYIVIDDGNRNSPEYRLNEELFSKNFNLIYRLSDPKIDIYKVD